MSKKKQETWQLCDLCGKLLYSRHLSDHRVLCDGGSSSECPQHAFIKDGRVLHGFSVDRNNKMFSDNKLPLSSRNDVVLLHVNTMKTCGLAVGKRVVVKSVQSPQEIICMAWPTTGVSPECVALSPLSCLNIQVSEGDAIEVRVLQGITLHATRVELQMCEMAEFEINQMFSDYCLQELRDQYVSVGYTVEVQFYGKQRRLQVTLVTGQNEPSNSGNVSLGPSDLLVNGDNTTEDLSDQLDALNISKTTKDMSETVMPCSNSADALDQGTAPCSNTQSCQEITCNDANGIHVARKEDTLSSRLKSQSVQSDIPHESWSPSVFYYIAPEETQLTIHAFGAVHSQTCKPRSKVTFESIGGLHKQVEMVREMIELPLKHPEMFSIHGLPPPRGVLLHGPSGTGKTLIAQAVAAESGAHFICINGPDVLSRYYGETEARLRDIFREAHERAPSIVFIDELDALCPKRDKVQNEFEKRVVATLLTAMDGVNTVSSSSHVVVLAATNRPDALDPALRRPGRLDREIEIGIPNARDREDILRTHLRSVPHNLTEENFVSFAEMAHGYVGADLVAVCKEAGLMSFKRCLLDCEAPSLVHHTDREQAMKERLLVTREDIMAAFRQVRPSAMREVAIDVPKVRWEDIGGNSVIKQKLKQAVEWPLKHPEAFQRLGIRPPKGILMYGPPGCSKTLIARALATESGLNFLAVKGPELFSKWVGESERAVRQVFQKARAAAPSIVFFDEIDALAVRRGSGEDGGASNVSDRVLTQLLTELDGVETLKDVVMVAATNRPDMIDRALLRPGRIDRIIYVPLPDRETRAEIFKIHLAKTPLGADVSLEELAEATETFSGAEISAVCREAALAALQEDIESVEVLRRHFDKAYMAVKPRTSRESIELYQKYQNECGVHSI